MTEAATGADLVMHLTEWADYRAIDPVALGRVVASRSDRGRPLRAGRGALAVGRLVGAGPGAPVIARRA